jgi:small subunit ribosomal protein S6
VFFCQYTKNQKKINAMSQKPLTISEGIGMIRPYYDISAPLVFLRSKRKHQKAVHFFLVMKHYELLTVLPGTMPEDEVPAHIQQVTALLEEFGATNVKTYTKGKSRLAYPMKHIRYGYFHLTTFELDPANMPGFQAKLKLSATFLRALVSLYDPSIRDHSKQEEYSVVQEIVFGGHKKRAPREERPASSNTEKSTEEKKEEAPKKDMKEINDKLDKILDDSDIADV